MKVDALNENPSLNLLFTEPNQIIFLDANMLIPPNRSVIGVKPYRFDSYREAFLEPLLQEFKSLSIHESVYLELVERDVKQFADEQISKIPASLTVYRDNELNDEEMDMLIHYLDKLAIHSKYDPDLDNAKDRGEVRTLSYMAVKKYMLFAANDGLPIRLIQNAKELKTELECLSVIQMYELVYYLYKKGKYDKEALKKLYKYVYRLSQREKKINPDWGEFVDCMDKLYMDNITKNYCI